MVDIFWVVFCVGMLIPFFFLGYRHDYRANALEFKRTIMGMPISLFSFMDGILFVYD
jgi:hypothetical protein